MMKNNSEERAQTQSSWPYHLSPRCGARCKSTGKPCRSPAVKNKARCRLHGGARGSGGQKGNKNSLKHGFYSGEQRALRHLSKIISKIQ